MSTPATLRRPSPVQSAARRTRVRRVVAFAGMLTTVAGLVGLRTVLTPTPHQALSSSGLATESATGGGAAGTAPTPRTGSGAGSATGKHVVVGKTYDVSYGNVQVRVTFTGTRISDVTPISLPEGGRSGDISQFAAPQLRREALAAQSAHIDTVSGASYTSAGYAMSLQSAIDQNQR
jgi:uncharacterized protein with FMN-binding domain